MPRKQSSVENKASPSAQDHARVVGERLRAARVRAGLTQAEVAAKSGLSLSFVRLVESGRSDISLSRLLKWTALFGLPVAELVSDSTSDDVVIVRPAERVEVPLEDTGVRFLLLSHGDDHEIEPAVFELAPGAAMQRPLTHRGEETAYVLRGQVRLWVGADQYTLGEGDCAYYSSQLPHRFSNASSREPACLHVTTTHPDLNARRRRAASDRTR